MRPLPLVLVLVVSVGFVAWAFAGSSFGTGVAVTGALGAGLLGLAVFGHVRRGPLRRGVVALAGTQLAYLALWVAGGLLWAGPPRSLPHFAAPVQLSLQELQGGWTREDGRAYEVRGMSLCALRPVESQELLPSEHPPPDACLRLLPEGRRLTLLSDDLALSLRAYRRWGREYLDAGLFDLKFSRPVWER